MRLPVSTNAVARIVNDPPSSIFRAAPKNFFGGIEGAGVDTARHDPPGGRLGQVVGPGQAGDAVEDNDDVAALLDHALGPLDGQLRDLGVFLGGTVERGSDHLSLHGPPHVGDFLGAFVDEKDDELHVGVVGLDGMGDLLENRGLARLRRGDDHPPLPLADGGDEVDDPSRHVGAVARNLEPQLLVGEEWRQVLETGPAAGLVWRQGGHGVDTEQRRIFFVATGRPGRPFEIIAFA